MYLTTWANVLSQSFYDLTMGLIENIPNLVAAVLVFIIGWVIGVLVGRLVAQVITSLPIDKALRSANVDRVLSRAGFSLNAGAFIGALIKWFVIIAFFMASLEVLNLPEVTSFLHDQVLAYLGQIIIAVFILLIAAVVADVAQRLIAGAAKAANIRSANFLGSVARYAMWIFAILVVLNHFRIGNEIFGTLFGGVVTGLALAFGLAFGLGGQQAAARCIEKMREQMKD